MKKGRKKLTLHLDEAQWNIARQVYVCKYKANLNDPWEEPIIRITKEPALKITVERTVYILEGKEEDE